MIGRARLQMSMATSRRDTRGISDLRLSRSRLVPGRLRSKKRLRATPRLICRRRTVPDQGFGSDVDLAWPDEGAVVHGHAAEREIILCDRGLDATAGKQIGQVAFDDRAVGQGPSNDSTFERHNGCDLQHAHILFKRSDGHQRLGEVRASRYGGDPLPARSGQWDHPAVQGPSPQRRGWPSRSRPS